MTILFTGIIEEVGRVREVRRGSLSCQIDITAELVLEDVKTGDSIAVNGTCLTVVKFNQDLFTADVMPETFAKTNLSRLKAGDPVNLERALKLSDRLGGHLVTGHVDGTGTIMEQNRVDNALVTRVSCPPELLRYIIPKGSIAVDGISLTVVEVMGNGFTVSLIPHTAKITSLGLKKPGDIVNLETDIIGKYVERLTLGQITNKGQGSGVTLEFLQAHGFGL